MDILILFDGDGNLEVIMDYIRHFNFPKDTHVKVLMAGKALRARLAVENAIKEINILLPKYFQSFEHEYVQGGFLQQAMRAAKTQDWDLVVYNEVIQLGIPFGIRRTHKGEKLVDSIIHPLLLIRNSPKEIQKVLLCTSGEPSAQNTLAVGGKLLSSIQPDLVLLHVMSQITLTQPGVQLDLHDTAESAMERQTREGLHFRMAIETLRENGFKGSIQPQIRHGLVLDEVLSVLRSQRIELLVIGSHHQAGRSRFVEFLLEDIARDLIVETSRSVLVIG